MYSFSVLCILVCFSVVLSLDLPECKSVECAEYKVIATKKDYEIREYGMHKMASTQSNGWIRQNWDLLWFLYSNNERGEYLPMVAPSLQYFSVDSKTNVLDQSSYKGSFFMGKSLGNNVPKPTSEKVKIDTFGPVTVYAVRFGGFMWTSKVQSYQKKLYNALKADGVDFDESFVVTASYNTFIDVFTRHNDLFYMAKDKNST